MKSILVALDRTPAAAAARATALALATAHRARLIGIGVLDKDYLTAAQAIPPGGAYYKFRSDLERLKHANAVLGELVETFEADCRQCKVEGRGVTVDGEPLAQVLAAAHGHDLIVLGRDTTFHGEPESRISTTVGQLLKHNPRPLLVTPPAATAVAPILVAYDGSIAAARALQMFTLLRLAAAEVHVVSIHPQDEAARATASGAMAYLELYGAKAHVHAIVSGADPADILIAQARLLSAGILVMGAFGHRGWREALLGSCTTKLLEECPTSLFVHH